MASATQEIYAASSQQPQDADPRDDYKLLLKCVRRALNPEERGTFLSITAAGVCWPRLLSLAHVHEVVPLLEFGLRTVSGVPAPVRRWLGTYCRTAVAHNLSLASELALLLDLFESSQLKAVPFKGPAWTMALYGSLALRQMADLDIFIQESQASKALDLLIDRGYVLSEQAKPIDEIRLDHKDIELIHPETGIHLELHWSACEPWFDRRLSTLNFWEPASTIPLLDRNMPLPSPEDLFFLLALHGFRHRWESLKWICDIATIVRAFPALDWLAVLSHAEKLSRKRLVLLPLVLAQHLFGAQLPDCVLEAIAEDPAVPLLARQLQQRQYGANTDIASSNSSVRGLIYREAVRIRSLESCADRFRLLSTLLFKLFKPTANDRTYFSPRTLPEPLCWLVRPFRLLTAYGPAFLLKLTGQLIAPVYRP